ncbi:hypothetical protein [Nocardia sp. CA-120079]
MNRSELGIICAIGGAGTAVGLALGTALLDWPMALETLCLE